MRVCFVGAGPGDPDLITIKGRRIIEAAPICVYAGSLVSREHLKSLPKGAKTYDSAKMSLDEVVAVYREAQAAGQDVVRLHTGDPSIYGAIAEQIEELDQLGIEWEVVPGVSSFSAAAAVVGAELTIPDVSQTVVLTRAAGRTPVPEEQALDKIGATRATLCIFLSAKLADRVSADLVPHYGADCPVAIVYKATWPDEKTVETTLAELPLAMRGAAIHKTAMILVGRALAATGQRSKLYDASFSTAHRRGNAVNDACAVVTLSDEGFRVARQLASTLKPKPDVFIPPAVKTRSKRVKRFTSGTAALCDELVDTHHNWVFIMPTGIVTRAIAPHVQSKYTDPAVVVVDVGARYAISLLSGHEGGANKLALEVANAIGAEPVVTTTTEARKNLIVGVGCRKGAAAQTIVDSIVSSLESTGRAIADVRLLATADIKAGERGLLDAAQQLALPLRMISSDEIRQCAKSFDESARVQARVGIPGVCEPVALLAGRKTRLVLPKTKFKTVTVAIAEESST